MKPLKINTPLFTKDGRVFGNGLITDDLGADLYEVKTDYGNSVKLSNKEIRDLFHVGFTHPWQNSQWWSHNVYQHKNYVNVKRKLKS